LTPSHQPLSGALVSPAPATYITTSASPSKHCRPF